MNPVFIAPLEAPLLINQTVDQSQDDIAQQQEERKYQTYSEVQQERAEGEVYPSLSKMPAYIALDISGIP